MIVFHLQFLKSVKFVWDYIYRKFFEKEISSFDCHKYSNWRQSGANDRMSMPLHLSIINSYWYNELFCMQTFYCLQFKLYCQISLSVKYPSECRINSPANVIKIDQSSMIIWMSRNIFIPAILILQQNRIFFSTTTSFSIHRHISPFDAQFVFAVLPFDALPFLLYMSCDLLNQLL